jgi:hypothetical protein
LRWQRVYHEHNSSSDHVWFEFAQATDSILRNRRCAEIRRKRLEWLLVN